MEPHQCSMEPHQYSMESHQEECWEVEDCSEQEAYHLSEVAFQEEKSHQAEVDFQEEDYHREEDHHQEDRLEEEIKAHQEVVEEVLDLKLEQWLLTGMKGDRLCPSTRISLHSWSIQDHLGRNKQNSKLG